MALVTTIEMLTKAKKNGYAICAFNVENMEMAMAVVKAAEEMHAPVIMQTTPSTVRYANLSLYHANIKALAEASKIPIALHLDHGNSFDLAMQALRVGYTSIMIDGSHLPFEENVAVTRGVVNACKPSGISVEAELGKVGGKEDDLDCNDPGYTEPEDAVRFVNETGVNSLAISIGTAHGLYNGEPKLDMDRLSTINNLVTIPLVLHGASGLPDSAVKECIARGISKVNFATELRIAYSNGVKEYLKDNPYTFDPKKYGTRGMEFVTNLVKEKIKVCGSDFKA